MTDKNWAGGDTTDASQSAEKPQSSIDCGPMRMVAAGSRRLHISSPEALAKAKADEEERAAYRRNY